jgi:hypothetical protein
MPAEYLIDRKLCVVFSRAWGVLTDTDLLEHQRRLGQDPQFEPSLNQIFDFLGVTVVEVTPMGIRTLAERTLFGAGARRAFVVHPGAMAMFGLMRMFEILTSEHPDELRVQFDHVKKAQQWIGIPDADGVAG